MEFKYLKTRRENRTLWVEIHNPPVNFIVTDMLEELHILIKKTAKDDGIRVFILTGGREDSYIMHYSIAELMMLTRDLRRIYLPPLVRFRLTSFFLKNYMTFTNWLMDIFPWYETLTLKIAKKIRGYSSGMFLWYQMMRTYYAIERMNKITIAAINGACNGGGTEIAACFDFRFMVGGQGFTIGQPECLVNIVPGGGGTQRLTRLIGKAKALELMLCGNQLSPEQAKDIGLLSDVFDKNDFHGKVQAFADSMSLRPPVAIDAIKKSVTQGLDTTVRHGLSIELEQSVRCFDTKDTEMALKSYLAYIDENIMTLDYENATTADIVNLLNNTLDVMENARLFKPFIGK
jgi:enoyl-CoA hydratase/carnithine racemase